MSQPQRGQYDAIVVGAGLGGLVCAAYLAKFGLSTLLLDRNDGPGGYAHAFRRGPYLIDPAVHVVPQAAPGETVDSLLEFLGVRERCTFQAMPTIYRLLADGVAFDAPAGLDEFTDAMCDAFPREAAGVRAFVDLCIRYVDEAKRMPIQLGMDKLDEAVELYPTVFAHRTETLGEVLARHVTDERAVAALTAIWQYLGLPPSRLAFEIFARFFVTLVPGSYHVVGGFQTVADAFVAALDSFGGEFVARSEVTRIRVEDGRVLGVSIGDVEIDSPVVVSNTDARRTFGDLVGVDHLPTPYRRKLERLRPSASMFVVYAATSLELDRDATAVQTIVHSSLDLDRAFDAMLAGEPDAAQVVVPSLHDDSLAPSGEHLVVAASLASYDRPWADEKERVQDLVLGLAERALPGMRERLTHLESATPLALERYTLNTGGAAAGWENSPDQSASRRLAYVTPIEGLYLAGQWTQAGSSLRVMVSGTHAAQIVLRNAGVDDVGPMF